MKIKGLGEKTVEKLGINSIQDIYTLNKTQVEELVGEKISNKLFAEIELSKLASFDKYLAAFSIPLIGNTAGKKLSAIINSVDEITVDNCKKAGLGDKATQSLMNWVTNEYPEFKTLPIKITPVAKQQEVKEINLKVCITGKLNDFSSRSLASEFLQGKGITVVSGVSKTLDYLIVEDNKPSSKLSKANSYGIPLITIKNLIEEINK